MKSNYRMKYIEMPLSVFASQYPAEYFYMVSSGLLSPVLIHDSKYVVRLQLSGGGFNVEIGYSNDDWFINSDVNDVTSSL